MGRAPASSPPSLPRSSWCREHLCQWPQLRGRSARLAPNLSALGLRSCSQGTPLEPVDLELLAPPPASPRPASLSSLFLGRSSPRSGEFPRVTRRTVLAFPSRLHLDIICERSCPQDDHAGRRCAQDDAARPGAELPTQRLPAGRYVRASAHPDPRAWDWLPHPNPGLQGLESCVPGSLFPGYSSSQEAQVGRGFSWRAGEALFRVLAANGALSFLQALGACLACSCPLHFALLFWSCCGEKGGPASQRRKQVLFLST